MVRYGFHASTILARWSGPGGGPCATRSASPSVITRSGSNTSRARRPPTAGMVPIGLAMISPSPRKHSATPITQKSARLGAPLVSLTALPLSASPGRSGHAPLRAGIPGSRPLRSQADHLAVLGVVAAVEVLRLPGRPQVGIPGARRVLLLERLVAAVVRDALGEVRALRRVDD